MKVGIISSSLLLSNTPGLNYSRWDAGYWLGQQDKLAKKVAAAEHNLKVSQGLLNAAKKRLSEEQKRVRRLQESGGLVVLSSTKEE
jgi:hypothetical protein